MYLTDLLDAVEVRLEAGLHVAAKLDEAEVVSLHRLGHKFIHLRKGRGACDVQRRDRIQRARGKLLESAQDSREDVDKDSTL